MRAVFVALTAFALFAPATAEARFKFRMSRPAPAAVAKPNVAPVAAPASAATPRSASRPGVVIFSTGGAAQAAQPPASSTPAQTAAPAAPAAAAAIPASTASLGVPPQRMGEVAQSSQAQTPGFKIVH